MRYAVVDAELDHLGVDHDELYLVGIRLVQEAYDERVHAHGFAGAGRTRNEQVRQLRYVADYGFAADVLTDRKRGDALCRSELGRVDDVTEVDGADDLVRHLDAHRGNFVGDGRNSDAHDAEGKRNVIGKIGQSVELHALLQLKVKPRDRGASRVADDPCVDAEALY